MKTAGPIFFLVLVFAYMWGKNPWRVTPVADRVFSLLWGFAKGSGDVGLGRVVPRAAASAGCEDDDVRVDGS